MQKNSLLNDRWLWPNKRWMRTNGLATEEHVDDRAHIMQNDINFNQCLQNNIGVADCLVYLRGHSAVNIGKLPLSCWEISTSSR